MFSSWFGSKPKTNNQSTPALNPPLESKASGFNPNPYRSGPVQRVQVISEEEGDDEDDVDDAHTHINDPNTYTDPFTKSTYDQPKSHRTPQITSNPSKLLVTPHDNVLADLLGIHDPGSSVAAQTDNQQVPSVNTSARPSVTVSTLTSSPVAPSAPAPARAQVPETLYDPYTGQRMGEYVQASSTNYPDASGGVMDTPGRHARYANVQGKDDEIWEQLSQILQLQSEIAMMHINMENSIIRGREERRKGKEKSQKDQDTDDNRGWTREATLGGNERGDEDVDQENQERTQLEEEIAVLPERFAEKKEAVDSMMMKLDDLSNALKTFHALPNPTIDFSASRSNTTSSGTSASPPQPQTARQRTTGETMSPLALSPLTSSAPTQQTALPAKSAWVPHVSGETAPMMDSPQDDRVAHPWSEN